MPRILQKIFIRNTWKKDIQIIEGPSYPAPTIVILAIFGVLVVLFYLRSLYAIQRRAAVEKYGRTLVVLDAAPIRYKLFEGGHLGGTCYPKEAEGICGHQSVLFPTY